MQPQLERHHGYKEDQLNTPIPHSAGRKEFEHGGVKEYDEGYDEGHEKKSMMNKVKAKAKKMKDTMKKHTPNSGGHDDHEHGDHDDYEKEEEYEDEDEEMVQAPEDHGTEGRFARPNMTTTPVDPNMATTTVDPKMATTPVDPNMDTTPVDPSYVDTRPTTTQPEIAPQKAALAAGLKGDNEERAVLEEDAHGSGARDKSENYQTKVADPTGRGTRDKSENYQTKVADPTGRDGEETGGLESSLDKLNIHDDSISPPNVVQSQQQQGGGGGGSYTEKLSSAAVAVADRAAQAKNAVVSKFGYGTPTSTSHKEHTTSTAGGGEHTSASGAADITDGSRGQETASAATGSVGEYGKKLVEGTYGKVMSTVQGPKKAQVVDTEMVDDGVPQQGSDSKVQGKSVKGYFFDKLSPGEEDRALSQVIAEALTSTERKGKEKEDMSRTVTTSEEVRRSLDHGEGTAVHEDDGGGLGGGTDAAGKTMVGRLKGAMTDWFGRDTGVTPPSECEEAKVHDASQK